ncbi:MAG: hypothetical protein WCD49_09955 [Candidatus Acidiferrales bacterium]
MAGLYGEINSKLDYQRVLRQAADIVTRILARTPANATMQGINKQLAAMKRWTDGGRKPTEIERRNIDVGLIAARELSGEAGELGELAKNLFALNNYFEDWPTDAQAASATDEDSLDEDD